MSFTSIASGDNWCTLAIVNQLLAAWSERRQAIGQSAVSPLSSGVQNAQAASLWSEMQQWCIDNCGSFVDHTATIAGEAAVPMFDATSFYAAANIPDGFRYATAYDPDTDDPTDYDDAMFSHGVAVNTGTPRHMLGFWLAQDLQSAFDAFRWTVKEASSRVTEYDEERQSTGGPEAVCNDARDQAIAVWALAGWTSGGTYVLSYATKSFASGPSEYTWDAYRSRCAYKYISLPTHVACSIDSYVFIDNTGTGVTFRDIDGIGAEEGKLLFHETLAEDDAEDRDGSQWNPTEYNASPMGSTNPVTCADDDGTYGYHHDTCFGVLKWSFEYVL